MGACPEGTSVKSKPEALLGGQYPFALTTTGVRSKELNLDDDLLSFNQYARLR